VEREYRNMKCFSFKEVSKNTQTVYSKETEESKNSGEEVDQSDFCRINPQNSFTFVSKTLHGFVVGPHNFTEQNSQGVSSMKNFTPVVHFKDEQTGKKETFRLMVYIGHKTMIAVLFEEKQDFSYDLLNRLDRHLAKHCPVISQLIDLAVSRVLQPDDPCKFFYYNEGNMAVKVSNLITRDIFNYELKLQLNQMHENFSEDSDLQEQQQNNQQYWLIGLNTCGREIYMIMPSSYSSTKVETEKKRNIGLYFQNLFL
jgi:hypothetical protein